MARAASDGRIETIFYLIRNGTPVDGRNARGMTALHTAAAHGRLETVRFLLVMGAEVNARDGLGASPLDWARTYGHTLVANTLRLAGGHRARGEAPRFYLSAKAI